MNKITQIIPNLEDMNRIGDYLVGQTTRMKMEGKIWIVAGGGEAGEFDDIDKPYTQESIDKHYKENF